MQKSRAPDSVDKALAGSFSMVFENILSSPLDVAKTRYQLATNKAGSVRLTSILLDIWKTNALWRGLAPALTMQVPRGALKFTVVDQVLRQASGIPGSGFLAGLAAGAVESVMITPFECIKVRLQSPDFNPQIGTSTAGGATSSTALSRVSSGGARRALKELLAQEGAWGLCRGMEATLWRNSLWNTVYFGLQPLLKKALPSETPSFVLGTVAGAAGSFFSTPVDVAKSRLQDARGRAPWAVPAIAVIWKSEGILALYRGLTPKLLRLGFGGGVLLCAYDTALSTLAMARA
mmetsp:Transcript_6570/g.15090  ORF Transcript_6570/g.15090 Transcript_6570/m.15090 type:complete len:291 (-) Transcript_6570:457-1329(-)|eukprot:CAMPEP_0206427392 /NCGR_PEP_ID=MMETSP0324_2-20121206/5006_1 /ASSEMBLY_ACC=CAM_ASM_000836 /TAXON_ID=2866 /ORGANISM="Crypthecodinium cohnii, Strain Seligo" /LENGTH=290 /DNA_ID=CAMNT_0053892649 /DNA_START=102 /DNA_END=974 /DNA_ORIENTATION=-